jgi:hypothetical protein
MPTLFLTCRKCGLEFPTPIAVANEGTQATVMISGLEHVCPSCGAKDQFFTGDYHLPKQGLKVPVEAHTQIDGSTPGVVPPSVERPSLVEPSVAMIGGDQQADEKIELQTIAGRLAGYGVQGGPGRSMEGPAPPYDSEAGE